jgi:hypothetical protein
MITITLSGFKTKEQAIAWLNQYEGSVEQAFDTEEPIEFPAMCSMEQYIPEMQAFEKDADKINFNLQLK